MDEQTFKQIKLLTEAQGTSGAEDDIRSIMTTQMTPLVDEVVQDGLGGVFGIKENKDNDAPRVMVAAHMDEVGFIVVGINDSGLLRVSPLGGWNPHVVSSQRFTLKTKEARYPVISSSVSPHLLRGKEGNQSLDVSDVLFDAGFESKEEAEIYGVRPGDSIVPDVETILTANKKNIMGKAWDNRYGCWLVLEILEHFKHTELPNTLIAGANVQEEVGLRGARPSVHKLNPDIFFAVDCSAADDIYSTTGTYGHLGEGFLLRILDPGMVTLPRMREFLYDIASTNNIEFQYFVSKGGTDAGAVHMMNDGIPSAVIGVCARYIHTHQSLYNISDFEAAREMLFATIAALDKSTVNTIIYGK